MVSARRFRALLGFVLLLGLAGQVAMLAEFLRKHPAAQVPWADGEAYWDMAGGVAMGRAGGTGRPSMARRRPRRGLTRPAGAVLSRRGPIDSHARAVARMARSMAASGLGARRARRSVVGRGDRPGHDPQCDRGA